jgi:hypothetical protein
MRLGGAKNGRMNRPQPISLLPSGAADAVLDALTPSRDHGFGRWRDCN